jgi:hypothetical protein
MLVSDGGGDPLSFLLASEEKPVFPSRANEQHSLASTYLTLLRHFGNKMHRVANHLLISPSHAYRCCAKAHLLTASQHALLLAPPATIAALRPWRRRRMLRMPRQMEFDFEDAFPLAAIFHSPPRLPCSFVKTREPNARHCSVETRPT